MNEILQQRIEEAARDIAELCPDCDFHCESPNPCMPKILYQKLVEIANFSLQNQWISVDEALPEIKEHFVSEDVICKYSDDTMGFSRLKENLFGQKWFEYEYEDSRVTDWMPIPEMKGGKK